MLECKRQNRVKGNKFNIPRHEHNLIEIDQGCLDILDDDDYAVSEDT